MCFVYSCRNNSDITALVASTVRNPDTYHYFLQKLGEKFDMVVAIETFLEPLTVESLYI